jgi:hypothetical protein
LAATYKHERDNERARTNLKQGDFRSGCWSDLPAHNEAGKIRKQ